MNIRILMLSMKIVPIEKLYENGLDVKFVEEANGIPQYKDG